MNAAFIDALKSALRVWAFTTLGLFIPGLLGWINEVTKWAAEKGAPAFPDASNLMYLFIAAITAAFPAAVAGLVRFAENLSGHTVLPRAAGPQTTPVNPPADHGRADVLYVALVVLVIVVIVILLF